MKTEYKTLKKLAVDYLSARKAFLEKSRDIDSLKGNDNIMGRIGELVALQYFEKEHNLTLTKAKSKVEKNYDLCSSDMKTRVSVKLISCENGIGQTTKVTGDWTDFVLVHLKDYKVIEIGHVSRKRFEDAVQDKRISASPLTRRTMLQPEHLFGKYGRIINGSKVKDYL
ncbi:MAG: hypothetical protein ACJ77K_08025 [Bacteroidia bacterium]